MGKYDLGTPPASEPVAVVQGEPLKQSRNWGLYAFMAMQSIVLVVVLVLVLHKGDTPGPQPVPPTPPSFVITEDVEKIVIEAEKKWLKNKAAGAERMAADIEAGRIKNSQQYGKMALEYQEVIENDALAKLKELNQKYVRESSDAGWTAEQLAVIKELQRRKAAGYRELLK